MDRATKIDWETFTEAYKPIAAGKFRHVEDDHEGQFQWCSEDGTTVLKADTVGALRAKFQNMVFRAVPDGVRGEVS